MTLKEREFIFYIAGCLYMPEVNDILKYIQEGLPDPDAKVWWIHFRVADMYWNFNL
ncbi:MAG: hypothetical protein K2J82_08010 [Muribaculaceae bacterium]|nr:hypothetical protein [Muribaculaceae bacterium]MDE6754540.1 hypothetical protein [Muribaculaceae bacterium]